MRLFFPVILAAALTGCGSATPATDLTATNAAIGANTSAVTDLAGKTDTNTAKIVDAINGLGGQIGALAPAAAAAPVKVDPDTCSIPDGMTPTVYDPTTRHVTGNTADVVRGMLVVTCDVNSVQGWQAWNVKGLKPGTVENGQNGLLVDAGGNAVNIDDIRGMWSTKPTPPKGKKYTVACLKDLGPDACKAKPVEKPDTVLTINGRKVTISGS